MIIFPGQIIAVSLFLDNRRVRGDRMRQLLLSVASHGPNVDLNGDGDMIRI